MAIIFDLDGVLVDTTPSNFSWWQDYMSKLGVNLGRNQFQAILGLKFDDVVHSFEKEFDIQIDSSDLKTFINTKQHSYYKSHKLLTSKAIPNTLSLLVENKVQLAVATGSDRTVATDLLQTNNLLSFFEIIVTADDVKNGKPDPEIYLTVARKLVIPPNRCVVIEDAKGGLKAAHTAGMKAIGYLNNFNSAQDLSEADLCIDDFKWITKENVNSLLGS